ncbi:MAG: 30S ribosomal protein S5 [Leptospiraceae bacterium]|nr:30S ribosomal protein S5 [Leptospiraceae bacterium]
MEEAKQTGKKPGRKKNAPKEGVKKNLLEIDGQTIELTERVVSMARVAKVVKGGRRFSFNALTVVGDGQSYVGLGFGKAKEVPEAIRKSIEDAKKHVMRIKRKGSSIPHEVIGRFKSARVMLKPGAPGTGIIAGESVRAVVELAGIHDILTKALGSSNPLNIVKATLDGLKQLGSIEEMKARRGIPLPVLFGNYAKQRRDEKRKALAGAAQGAAAPAPSAPPAN